MEPDIYYTFQARLIRRRKDNGEFEFIDVSEKFIDPEPIKAREAALRYYQNYIDVLLQSKGAIYQSDKQARQLIKSFWDPGTTSTEIVRGKAISIPDSSGNGIGVFCCHDNPFEEFEDSGRSLMIHGIGSLYDGDSTPEGLMLALEIEYNRYKRYNYNTDNQEIRIVFCDSNEWNEGHRDEPQTYTILPTPFDWSGMDKPYWWDTNSFEIGRGSNRTRDLTIEDLIADGENNQVEFKPAMLYQFESNNEGKSMKYLIVKTICAFLNSKGGFLFIGVNDKGSPVGLASDFALSGDKDPKDFFRLQFDNIVRQYLPYWTKEKINADFYTLDAHDIFVVSVFPSMVQPVFLKNKDTKEFYVRWTASSMRYTDIEEIVKYCLEHWGKD